MTKLLLNLSLSLCIITIIATASGAPYTDCYILKMIFFCEFSYLNYRHSKRKKLAQI